MHIHCHEIRQKVINIACEMMTPLMRDASNALADKCWQQKFDGGICTAFQHMMPELVKNMKVISGILEDSWSQDEARDIQESIMRELIVWLEDGMKLIEDNSDSISTYASHIEYLVDQFEDMNVPSCLTGLQRKAQSITLQ